MQINHRVFEIIPTDQKKDKGFNYTVKFPLPNFKEWHKFASQCWRENETAKKKETTGVSFEVSSVSPIAPFTWNNSKRKRRIVNLYASYIQLLLYLITSLWMWKGRNHLTFHCSERAGQRKKSSKGAVVSSRARGGKRVQGALGTVMSCGTVPGWGVEPSPVTVETSLTEQWKGRTHWTKKAWREKKKTQKWINFRETIREKINQGYYCACVHCFPHPVR